MSPKLHPMSNDVDVTTSALNLPPNKRAELAHRLLLSLDPPDFDDNIEEEWAAEVEKRLTAADRDETSLVEWRPAIERIRHSLSTDPST